MAVKQVIVIRKDLNMRRGKEIAQGAHASITFLKVRFTSDNPTYAAYVASASIKEWLNGNQAKITLQVNSEAELLDIYQKAHAAGLEVHLITDAGLTEFDGVPTKTCLAIGPDEAEKIDPITGHLKLY